MGLVGLHVSLQWWSECFLKCDFFFLGKVLRGKMLAGFLKSVGRMTSRPVVVARCFSGKPQVSDIFCTKFFFFYTLYIFLLVTGVKFQHHALFDTRGGKCRISPTEAVSFWFLRFEMILCNWRKGVSYVKLKY